MAGGSIPHFQNDAGNATIDIGPGRSLYLGNRDPFERSFAGSLYYAAIYDRPLTLTEIETHVEYLIVHDD